MLVLLAFLGLMGCAEDKDSQTFSLDGYEIQEFRLSDGTICVITRSAGVQGVALACASKCD